MNDQRGNPYQYSSGPHQPAQYPKGQPQEVQNLHTFNQQPQGSSSSSYGQNPKLHEQGTAPQVQPMIQQNPVTGHALYQQPQNQGTQQPQVPVVVGPQVETVAEDGGGQFGMTQSAPQPSQEANQGPPLNEGTGVDARTKPEPGVEASRRAATSQGAPGSAEGRKALLESALRCDLPTYLVDSVLENPNLSRVKDPASLKVHAVELLKLLTQDPGYGMKFQLLLEKIPAWKKYVSQDHSLFITGPEQKTDYFLTDGSSSDPTKLLTQG
mmetsp:Transcript_1535/g.2656  ORF Transcript_1535/g.2656 Transcript_1535/m.2656 type:complete len:268 (+) Transcript_1535:1485-2288(+)